MSKVVTTTLLPDVAGGSVTLGGTGDSVVVTGNDIRTNVLQDAGGNAVLTSDGSGVMSGMNSVFGGALNLITTSSFTNQTSVAFTTQLTSTYDVYIFKFIDINPSTDNQRFEFQVNASGQTGYNETITSTFFYTRHSEADTNASLTYYTGGDQAQGTSYQNLGWVSNDADHSLVGDLHLFSPSNTTYVKHFYSRTTWNNDTDGLMDGFIGGYINVTAAITGIDFKIQAGTFDGTIKLYGISKS